MSSVSGETPGRREHLFRGRRVKVRDLIDANLLKPGAVLVYDRPQVGETFQVTVTETGRLRLPDGRETGSLSGAVWQLSRKNVDGWYAWRTADTGELLHSLRQQLLEQAVREVPDEGHSDLEARQDEFVQSAKKAAESGSPFRMSVRELIGIWGARGRDFEVKERVDADLANADFHAANSALRMGHRQNSLTTGYGSLAGRGSRVRRADLPAFCPFQVFR